METSNGTSWIFFVSDGKPTSMRRAIAERLAKDESVVIVNLPISFLRDDKLLSLNKRCKRLSGVDGAWDYHPLHFPVGLPGLGRLLKELNEKLLRQELDKLLPENSRRIVCYDSPAQEGLAGKLKDNLSIYLAIDDRTITVWGQPIRGEFEKERKLLSRVDKVICVSERLAEVLRSRVPSGKNLRIFVLPNGYDERWFDPTNVYPEPGMLMGIPRPRILVAGHVSERIDWEGIIGSTRFRPEWTWIFLGPADSGMKEKISSALRERGFYHPPIPVLDVPAWINHCDVCAVPYRLNSFTRASHPLKALEYLAMGAPVLSTRISSLECYGEAIEWVNEGDGESYARALGQFANQAGGHEIRYVRQRAVSQDSWGVRVNQFRQIVFSSALLG